jgi:hypothetical protein
MVLLMALVQSVIRRFEDFQILCVPRGRIHGRTHGYEWSLLKVREEEKYKGDMVGPGGSWKPREHVSVLQVLLKPMITHGKGEPGDSHQ